jgi:hypothetical protein
MLFHNVSSAARCANGHLLRAFHPGPAIQSQNGNQGHRGTTSRGTILTLNTRLTSRTHLFPPCDPDSPVLAAAHQPTAPMTWPHAPTVRTWARPIRSADHGGPSERLGRAAAQVNAERPVPTIRLPCPDPWSTQDFAPSTAGDGVRAHRPAWLCGAVLCCAIPVPTGLQRRPTSSGSGWALESWVGNFQRVERCYGMRVGADLDERGVRCATD